MPEFDLRGPDGTRHPVSITDDVAALVLVKAGPDGRPTAVAAMRDTDLALTPAEFAGLLHDLADNMPPTAPKGLPRV